MARKRISITLNEQDGKKIDAIAAELGLDRTKTVRLLISTWAPWRIDEVKQQLGRQSNLIIYLAYLVAEYIKRAAGSDVFYQLNRAANERLRSYKHDGRFLP